MSEKFWAPRVAACEEIILGRLSHTPQFSPAVTSIYSILTVGMIFASSQRGARGMATKSRH
jgi:hypothetical protein